MIMKVKIKQTVSICPPPLFQTSTCALHCINTCMCTKSSTTNWFHIYLISLHTKAELKHRWKAYVSHVYYSRNYDRLDAKMRPWWLFWTYLISYIILDILWCSVMLKTDLSDSLPKYVGVNSRKMVLDGPDFDISSILNFKMVISFAAFSSFMSWYRIKYAPIVFILFLLESSYVKI